MGDSHPERLWAWAIEWHVTSLQLPLSTPQTQLLHVDEDEVTTLLPLQQPLLRIVSRPLPSQWIMVLLL